MKGFVILNLKAYATELWVKPAWYFRNIHTKIVLVWLMQIQTMPAVVQKVCICSSSCYHGLEGQSNMNVHVPIFH